MPVGAVDAMPLKHVLLAEAAMSLFQLAEAVEVLEPPSIGRRRVEVVWEGDNWVMYRVVTDTTIRIGYADWRKVRYKVFVVIDFTGTPCIFYNGDGIVVGHKMTARDLAELLGIEGPKQLVRLVWDHVNKALQGYEGEPCEGVWVLR